MDRRRLFVWLLAALLAALCIGIGFAYVMGSAARALQHASIDGEDESPSPSADVPGTESNSK